ncbi:hypothetical protein [Streptomyces sp. CBMA152]|uniref:hypothetical protein n=1 Tax=Streptomyces sp. CBMA152 TaxID=1896312 RepID=UPI001660D14B|nr:hypothetical protein [Streptomyces sp. CBMA152]MBD0744192.1 hypothetical protein [Streptomyces sp. CBMA152]
MFKRILATSAALGAALASIVTVAPSASATESGFACRSDYTPNHSWANWGGANIDACIARNGSQIIAGIGANNTFPSDPCAQLVDADTGKWLYDFGCYDKRTGHWLPAFSGNNYYNYPSIDLPKTGRQVVVQVGFWADFGSGVQYYMNVQSPRIIF